MNVVVTGGSGFVGSALVSALIESGHKVTTIDRRSQPRQRGVTQRRADLAVSGSLKPSWFTDADAVIHLSGANLFRRWTRNYKKQLRTSRVDAAANIARTIMTLPKTSRPCIIITASTAYYYGDRREQVLTEVSQPSRDFLSELTEQWEGVWADYLDESARFVAIRSGVVLNYEGGVLNMLKPLIKRGLGAVVGDGRQWISWISLPDLINVYLLALQDNRVYGPVNAVAPKPIRQVDLITRLSRIYDRSPRLRLPRWVIRTLMGEAGDPLLFSERVKPAKLLALGYQYERPTITSLKR